MSRAVLSLGSNLGDRFDYLNTTIEKLREVLVAVSGVYETRPWGVREQDDFLNAVCIVDDPARDAWAWLSLAHELERQARRVRTRHWGPRTLDVDVIDVDGAVMNNPRLTLPHPSAAKRAFVLIPWLEIEPEAALPEKGSVRALLAALSPKALSPKEVEGVRLRGELSFDVKADPTP